MNEERHEKFRFRVTAREAGIRLDTFLAGKIPEKSRRNIRRAIGEGSVFLNKRRVKINSRIVRENDIVTAYIGKKTSAETPAPAITIVYEDSCLFAVNKPAGIPSTPTRLRSANTLPDILRKQFPRLKFLEVVHRLDAPTSGVILVGKKASAIKKLMELFRLRKVHKQYLAVVEGKLPAARGCMESFLQRSSPPSRKVRSVATGGKKATTLYRMLRYYPEKGVTLIQVKILTGRTHQIRVHFSEFGYPVLGDALYGTARQGENLMLHAYSVGFPHPETGEFIVCTALPESNAWNDYLPDIPSAHSQEPFR